MAALTATSLTLLELTKRLKPDGSLDMIVEMMDQDQECLSDIPWVEANSRIGHRTTLRSTLPAGAWRKLNSGVPVERSTTVQITETVGMLETYLEVDKELAVISGDVNKFRAQETRGASEGLSQTMATTLFYGDTGTDPEKFLGLEARYDLTSLGNGANIILGGGSGADNSSIWLINWRDDKVHGLFAENTSAGLMHEDLGEERVYDASSNGYQALVSHMKWNIGLCVRDWRYIVRIANIDDSALTKDASAGADLLDLMAQAEEQIKDMNGSPRWYCTNNVRSFLRRQINNKSNLNLTYEDFAGKRTLTYNGNPIRKTNALLNNEATVS